jgi:hypothetical protein
MLVLLHGPRVDSCLLVSEAPPHLDEPVEG